MASKYKDIDLDYELDKVDEEPEVINEIGYPVHVYFIELAKEYMKRIQWHWHPELEVLIVNHGQMEFQVNEHKEILSAGQGVIVNSNIMHSVERVDPEANCSMYSTTFHPAFLFGFGDVALTDKYMSPIISSNNFQFMTLDESNETQAGLLDLVNEIIAINLVKKYGYEISTKSILCKFWLELLDIVVPDDAQKATKSIASLDEARAKEMILYIEEHYADKVTLDELSASVHISKSECCRCFKRALNLTPVEYLMKYRIYIAASYIKKKDKHASSFSELAFNVGFNNASYFNKVFKQYLGCTPSEYRRKLASDPNFDIFGSMKL